MGCIKTRTPQTYGDADDQGGWRNGDVTGVGYMRSHESGGTMDTKWFKQLTRRAVSRKRRLHERSCRRVLPNAERKTDEKQSLFSRNLTENARARVCARYVKASGKQFYQKSDGREKEYRCDRHT